MNFEVHAFYHLAISHKLAYR